MTTSQLTGGPYSGTVEYIESPVFIFSPAPIIISMPDAPDGYEVTLKCAVSELSRSYDEKRVIRGGKAHFEISRILQHLGPDVSDVFNDDRAPRAAYFTFAVRLTESATGTVLWSFPVFNALMGALDQGETYAYGTTPEAPITRRLWVNYPQTVTVADNEVMGSSFIALDFSGESFKFINQWDVAGSGTPVVGEVNLIERLYKAAINADNSLDDDTQAAAFTAYSKLTSGSPVVLGLSTRFRVTPEGHDSGDRATGITGLTMQHVKFIPDKAPRGEGTYLRWLQRDGSFGYWHFQNGDISVAAEEGNAFQRTILGNPAEAQNGRFMNPAHADFIETRTLALGATVNDASEYDYLLGLATSPVVERFIEQSDGSHIWQRVNVAPGSYTRNRRWFTPRRSAFDITIILPQRNTIKL